MKNKKKYIQKLSEVGMGEFTQGWWQERLPLVK